MKKIVITEEQMGMVNNYVSKEESKSTIINETIMNKRYEQKCNIDFNYGSDVKYKGREIEDIGYKLEYTLSFIIDQEHRSWGIKNISVYDVQGPEELETEVEFYNEGSDDLVDEYITIKVDWDQVKYESQGAAGMVGIDQDVQISLGNDSEGNIIANEIIVYTYGV